MNYRQVIPLLILIFVSCKNETKQIIVEKSDSLKFQLENQSWIRKFENTKNDSIKIELIKNKIKADSSYTAAFPKIPNNDMPSAKTDNKNANGILCGCRISFTFKIGKDKFISADLSKHPKLSPVIAKLESNNIENIEYINPIDGEILFGPMGKCGALYISIKDDSLKKQIATGI